MPIEDKKGCEKEKDMFIFATMRRVSGIGYEFIQVKMRNSQKLGLILNLVIVVLTLENTCFNGFNIEKVILHLDFSLYVRYIILCCDINSRSLNKGQGM